MYSVKKSFLVFPTSSGKDVSKVDLKKFFVKSCKDRGKDKDKGKGKDKDKDKDKEKDKDKDKDNDKYKDKDKSAEKAQHMLYF